jgi:hypothetical protein
MRVHPVPPDAGYMNEEPLYHTITVGLAGIITPDACPPIRALTHPSTRQSWVLTFKTTYATVFSILKSEDSKFWQWIILRREREKDRKHKAHITSNLTSGRGNWELGTGNWELGT